MQATTVRDRAAGASGLSLTEMPYPHAAENAAIIRVHAAGWGLAMIWRDPIRWWHWPPSPSGCPIHESRWGTFFLTLGTTVAAFLDNR